MPPSLAPTTLPTNNHCHHLLLATAASTAITRLAAQRTLPTGLRHHCRWTTHALSVDTPIVPSTIAMRAPAGEGGFHPSSFDCGATSLVYLDTIPENLLERNSDFFFSLPQLARIFLLPCHCITRHSCATTLSSSIRSYNFFSVTISGYIILFLGIYS